MSDTGTARPGEPLAALALLEDPQRAALYEFIVAQEREVSRGEAAKAVGLLQSTAATIWRTRVCYNLAVTPVR